MEPLSLYKALKNDMVNYVSSKFPFLEKGQKDLDQQIRRIMQAKGSLFQDPVLQPVLSRKKEDLSKDLFGSQVSEKIYELTKGRPYAHQIQAWKRILANQPTVVATGTGSGKSECFLFPVIEGLLRKGFAGQKQKVGAVFIYPMNALVEDQFLRLHKILQGTGLRAGIYNGTYRKPSERVKEQLKKKLNVSDEAVMDCFVDPERPETLPHILLTNYKMLEYMLMRNFEQSFFENMDLNYLVLDESHLYTGTLGLEVACLIARLRTHLEITQNKPCDFLPIATSATLMQSQEKSHDPTNEMAQFFGQLFGKPFPEGSDWLIKEQFEEMPPFQAQVFSEFISLKKESLQEALKQNFPDNYFALAKIAFSLDLEAVPRSTDERESPHFINPGKVLFPYIREMARQLPNIILKDSPEDLIFRSVVSWELACSRFEKACGGKPEHLEALLILCNHAYENDFRFPALGLRLHAFGRAEPKIYWSLDEKTLLDEEQTREQTVPSLDYMNCRKCGHSAWGALLIPTSGNQFEAQTLPAFYETFEMSEGSEIAVFHPKLSVETAQTEKKDWSFIEWGFIRDGQNLIAKPLSKADKPENFEFLAFRVERKSSKNKQLAPDTHSCPVCGSTAGDDKKAIISTNRSGAAADLGVYGASTLTQVHAKEERRLLIFTDNRQESAFLAGFLTNRHRRLNLRRAIASFLDESSKKQWPLLKEIDSDRYPKGHRFDFAARLILSLIEGKVYEEAHLPVKQMVSRQIFTDLIPKDALHTPFRERRSQENSRTIAAKDWLLNNQSLERQNPENVSSVNETVDLFDDYSHGSYALELLHQVILLELTSLVGREGSLQALGLATWGLDELRPETFKDFVTKNPDLGLNENACMSLSHWLIQRVAESGQWTQMTETVRRQTVGYKGKSPPKTLAQFLPTAKKGEFSKNSQLSRILIGLGGDSLLKKWSQLEIWKKLLSESPLRRYLQVMPKDESLRLDSNSVYITSDVTLLRGNISRRILSVPTSYHLENHLTGKKDEVWEACSIPEQGYYRELYLRSLKEEPRLVRALEHNGMLGAETASDVIERFEKNEINTVVATPTLEMGVDIPDLPVTFMRTVPPDPSNYAQRAGRAGRAPKKALVATRCGMGSHDLNFFANPEAMVAGEILPPGLPAENTSIIIRHMNGLMLELLALNSQNSAEQPLDLSRWDHVINLAPLRNEYRKITGEQDLTEPEGDPNLCDWKKTLKARLKTINHAQNRFCEILKAGIWSPLADDRKENLKRELLQKCHPDQWAELFQKELDHYTSLGKYYVDKLKTPEMEQLRLRATRPNPDWKDRQDIYKAHKMASFYLLIGHQGEINHPLSQLGARSFLPHFDFPGQTVRFIGLGDENDKEKSQEKQKFLIYNRDAVGALREFAPQQNIYGQGFIYKVDRYRVRENPKHDLQKWGLCKQGCTDLVPPEYEHCHHCQGPLITMNSENTHGPKLLQIAEATGTQEKVIADGDNSRTQNASFAEIKTLHIPKNPDKRFVAKEIPEIDFEVFTSPEKWIQTATVLRNKKQKNSEVSVLYRECEGEQEFGVRVEIKEEEQGQYEPFVPVVFSEGQALTLNIPFPKVTQSGYLNADETDTEKFVATLSAVLTRSIQNVLRLNKRRSFFSIFSHLVQREQGLDNYVISQQRLVILDLEEGGSGVIDLIWQYWNQIIDKAKLILESCECSSSCYKCLRSYENQKDHQSINRHLFLREGKAVLFDLLKREQLQATEVEDQNREADEKSGAEKVFKAYLDEKGFTDYETQVEIRNKENTLITVPDFVLNSTEGYRTAIFIDGQDHFNPNTFYKDIEKRNYLSQRGYKVLTLPGSLISPFDHSTMDTLISSIHEDVFIPLPTNGESLESIPGRIDKRHIQRNKNLLVKRKWQKIEEGNFWKNLDSKHPLHRVIEKQRKILSDSKATPRGLCESTLLIIVPGEYLVTESEGLKRWRAWLTLQSCWAAMGYQTLVLWEGELPSAAA